MKKVMFACLMAAIMVTFAACEGTSLESSQSGSSITTEDSSANEAEDSSTEESEDSLRKKQQKSRLVNPLLWEIGKFLLPLGKHPRRLQTLLAIFLLLPRKGTNSL